MENGSPPVYVAVQALAWAPAIEDTPSAPSILEKPVIQLDVLWLYLRSSVYPSVRAVRSENTVSDVLFITSTKRVLVKSDIISLST
jgi:hypothetical protein